MNRFMKKAALSVAALLVLGGVATGCSGGGTGGSGEGKTTVGIIQYASHPSLDNCTEGFKEGLKEGGYTEGDNLTIDFQNAQNDNANAETIAKNMVSKKYNLICGVATPAAMAAYSATKGSDIPTVFTAVSDPVSAGLVKSLDKPENNATGSSDVLPLEAQIKMIRAFLPGAKKIGILYTTSEPNSVSQLEKFKEIAPTYGFEVEALGVTNASEVAAGAATLVSKKVDCFNNFTDNNVVDNLTTVLNAADGAGIPVFGSEEEQVKNGCLASEGIDYVALGKETGKMAAKILKGEAKASEMPVYQAETFAPVYNKTVMEKLGLTLPTDLSTATNIGK
ncbi:ABC transporter substrate-binding protein [Eubacterium aggregans]|uniref:ABC transporter substrate-binding protein n=1 Tax=Eubacterium aggregans TaxID=81409 RepID=UPI0023F49DAA|nr:ABC transporter substrate-binding protein [Eubacterium aggregans]MDD4692408.1 ABC transporter substrate-binding protein [Eubacterium aggregans]